MKVIVTSLFPASAAAQDTAARLFGEELHRSGIRYELCQVAAPPGAKSGAVQAIGQLVVAGAFSAAVVQAVSRIAVAYINRRSAQKIVLSARGIELEIDGDLGEPQRKALAQLITMLQDDDGSAVNDSACADDKR